MMQATDLRAPALEASGRSSAARRSKPMELSRRRAIAIFALFATGVCAATVVIPSIAYAAERFDAARFAEAQNSGKAIVVGVHADWCSVCAVQKRIVAGLLAKPEFARAVHFHVDYDRDKDVLSRFKVLRQSTILVFKGAVETGRLLAETSPEKIEAALRSGL